MSEKNLGVRVRAVDIVKDRADLWISPAVSNLICSINGSNDTLSVKAKFEQGFMSFPYSCIEKYKNNLLFVPQTADSIVVYNSSTGEISTIELREVIIHKDASKNRKEVYRKTIKFRNCFCWGSKIYLLGFYYPAIICLDMETFAAEYITDWIDKVEERIDYEDERGYFGEGSFEKDGYIYFPCSCTDCLVKLNPEDNRTELVYLECGIDGITGMQIDGEYLWLTGRKEDFGKIYRYNMNTKEIMPVVIPETVEHGLVHYRPYWKLVNYGDYIWLFPYLAYGTYKIKKDTFEIEKIERLNDFKRRSDEFNDWFANYMVKRIDDVVYIVTCEGVWYEVDLPSEKVRSHVYTLPNDLAENEISEMFRFGICFERDMRLETFLNAIEN